MVGQASRLTFLFLYYLHFFQRFFKELPNTSCSVCGKRGGDFALQSFHHYVVEEICTNCTIFSIFHLKLHDISLFLPVFQIPLFSKKVGKPLGLTGYFLFFKSFSTLWGKIQIGVSSKNFLSEIVLRFHSKETPHLTPPGGQGIRI